MTPNPKHPEAQSKRVEAGRTECEQIFGHNYGSAKDDPFWDCIHVLAPGERETTLCGEPVSKVAQACSLDCGRKPGEGNGCWTCLDESNRWANPITQAQEERKGT